jgi:aminoglycoside phosphotransferase (APT) family kinase protein
VLSTTEVLPYLSNHGLLVKEAMVDGRVLVFDASRRNRNFRVVCDDGPSMFIKQGAARADTSTTASEARVYELLSPQGAGALRFSRMPRLLAYEPEDDVLVLELVSESCDLRDLHARRRTPPVLLARRLGEALAELHMSVPPDEARASLGEAEAGVMSAHRPGLAALSDFSAAGTELLQLVQRIPSFEEQLLGLRAEWRSDSLIHHDVRWDNILMVGPGRSPRVVLLDWETAAVGDPAWDVGCALGEYLSLWLMSIPGTGQESAARMLDLAQRPLSGFHPAVSALWVAYVKGVGLSAPAAASMLSRCVRYAGLKLIQSALEQVQGASRPTVCSVLHLQVATNVMERPVDAAGALLGLGGAA